ncbi:MAG: hypothetical protein PHP37_00645 [Patescibacteria group bacterium]|nr:hypothetical protein [Patescibacteria group bacterium]
MEEIKRKNRRFVTNSGRGEYSEIISEALRVGVKRLITHKRPDLDAIASLWFTTRFLLGIKRGDELPKIMFVPAGWKGPLEPGDLALDISVNGQGVKGSLNKRNETVHSCLYELFNFYGDDNVKKILWKMVTLIDAHDSHGYKYASENQFRGINDISQKHFAGWFFTWRYQSVIRPDDYFAICERLFEDFDGYYVITDEFINCRFRTDVINNTTIIGKTALYINNSGRDDVFSASSIIFDKLQMSCYVYLDGFDLGIILNEKKISNKFRADHEEIKEVVSNAGEAEGWFSHDGGAMYSWGTKKSHATKASNVDPFILTSVVERVRSMYCD